MSKLLMLFLSSFLAFGVMGNLIAQVFPMEIFSYQNSPDRSVNITIMGDGYTSFEQDKFIEDSKKAFMVMLGEEPWKSFPGRFNIYAIKVPSKESGAASGPDQPIDNYFKSTFNFAGIERLLVPLSYERVFGVLNSNTPFYDIGVIIVNDSRFGGSGGNFATFSTGPASEKVMIHELGHSFGGLADEYWVGDQWARERSNMSKDNNSATNRWRQFINMSGVSIYPHQESPTWYRPHQNCKMRVLGAEFCLVCQNELNNEIEFLTQGATAETPIAFFGSSKVEIFANDSIHFYDLTTQTPKSWEWSFEGGIPASSTLKNPMVSYAKEGIYAVTLKAKNDQGENIYTRNQAIKVIKDLVPPEIKTKNIEILLDENGLASLSADQVNDGTRDNDTVKEISISKTKFDCSNLGENLVIFKAKDLSENESSSVVKVTVIDKNQPIAKAKNVFLKLDESGKGRITFEMIDDGSIDNCGIESHSFSKSEFTIGNAGQNSITMTVKDASGNVGSATVVVEIDIVLSLEKGDTKGIRIYPNPTDDILKIEFAESSNIQIKSIEIIDVRGVVISETKEFNRIQNLLEVDVRSLQNGSYFIRINTADSSKILRFLVNR
jgi:PKD repeat protein